MEDFDRLEEQIEEALKVKFILETAISSLTDGENSSDDREAIENECADMKGFDWFCKKCKYLNFPTINHCSKCNKPKN